MASAGALKNAIKSFYSDNYGANIDVTLVMYDAAGAETLVAADSVSNVYTITVLRALSSDSTTQAAIIERISTQSTISFALPRNV